VGDHVAREIAHRAKAGRPIRAVMLDRLGPLVWHSTPALTMALLEELEETAALWLHCDRNVAPLSGGCIDQLREQFAAPW
jgi:ribulose-5-phosphate 4-epimerase/fuculose-1-phosphate aldolase